MVYTGAAASVKNHSKMQVTSPATVAVSLFHGLALGSNVAADYN